MYEAEESLKGKGGGQNINVRKGGMERENGALGDGGDEGSCFLVI